MPKKPVSKPTKPKSKTKALQVDPCQVCFTRPRQKGVYRKLEGKVVLLYEACQECHDRVVQGAHDFGHPEWIEHQRKLETEHGKTK